MSKKFCRKSSYIALTQKNKKLSRKKMYLKVEKCLHDLKIALFISSGKWLVNSLKMKKLCTLHFKNCTCVKYSFQLMNKENLLKLLSVTYFSRLDHFFIYRRSSFK